MSVGFRRKCRKLRRDGHASPDRKSPDSNQDIARLGPGSHFPAGQLRFCGSGVVEIFHIFLDKGTMSFPQDFVNVPVMKPPEHCDRLVFLPNCTLPATEMIPVTTAEASVELRRFPLDV